MGFPERPKLIDDDPMASLRLVKGYLQDIGKVCERYAGYLLIALLAAAVMAFLLSCLIWGLDATLPVMADTVPLLIAVIGLVMSYEQPKQGSHFLATITIFIAGSIGVLILAESRIRNE